MEEERKQGGKNESDKNNHDRRRSQDPRKRNPLKWVLYTVVAILSIRNIVGSKRVVFEDILTAKTSGKVSVDKGEVPPLNRWKESIQTTIPSVEFGSIASPIFFQENAGRANLIPFSNKSSGAGNVGTVVRGEPRIAAVNAAVALDSVSTYEPKVLSNESTTTKQRGRRWARDTAINNSTPSMNKEEEEQQQQRQQQQQQQQQQHQPNYNRTKRLNILVLYPDDWRHDSIGGVIPVLKTPFLNKLAKEGIRFTHNCVTTSICWISRATYFTGQYASRHKSDRLRNPVFYESWNESWPGLLRSAGYYTGHVGKWQYHGFDNDRYFNYTFAFEGQHWYKNQDYPNNRVHGSDLAKDKAISFLRTRPKDKPFALNVAFYPPKAVGTSSEPGAQWSPKLESMALYVNDTIPKPHGSWEKLPWFFRQEQLGRSGWKQRFEGDTRYQISMKNYYRLITEVDSASEWIVAELERQGVLNETLIIFTTDNGFFLGEHGLGTTDKIIHV